MNRDDIIAMAREAGFVDGIVDIIGFDGFANFAALVAAAERNRNWTQKHWTDYERSIAAAEREACAQLCLETEPFYGVMFAEVIRARGEK